MSLVIFARYPWPGKVKSRLAASIGPQAAAEFYKVCAESIFHEAQKSKWPRCEVHFSCSEDLAVMQTWIQQAELDAACFPQIDDPDLGSRMLAALSSAQARGGAKVAIIGTDIPDICAPLLDAAFDALDGHQMVIGPAYDGGYYLLASLVIVKELFQDVTWSTSAVLKETLMQAFAAGITVAPGSSLPQLQDIDVCEDLQAWASGQTSLEAMPSKERAVTACVNRILYNTAAG
eukprot:jgi/Astpho2/7870/fgenesh1_pg.00117_%23_62_t